MGWISIHNHRQIWRIAIQNIQTTMHITKPDWPGTVEKPEVAKHRAYAHPHQMSSKPSTEKWHHQAQKQPRLWSAFRGNVRISAATGHWNISNILRLKPQMTWHARSRRFINPLNLFPSPFTMWWVIPLDCDGIPWISRRRRNHSSPRFIFTDRSVAWNFLEGKRLEYNWDTLNCLHTYRKR